MIDPGIYRFLEVLEAQKNSLPEATTLEARRVLYNSIARNLRLPTPPNIETDREDWIDSDGGPVRVRIFRHQGSGPQPALVYLHGGGFWRGSPESHWDTTARLASWTRQTVISVDYALAPENPYPVALKQALAVIAWAREQAERLGIDAARIAVGGDGTGGNLAAAAATACRDAKLPLRAALLIYPILDFDLTRPSCRQNADGPLLRLEDVETAARHYCPDTALLSSDPMAAPLRAERHEGLPPTFLALAANDPMRDSAAQYAEALQRGGVSVTVDEGEGLVHDYLRAQSHCTAAEDKLRIMSDWLYEVFLTPGAPG
nr:alpha/beta hydrolase [Martelella radicis]